MVPFQPDPAILALLVLIAFVSGMGITTIGPGGIFVTIALYSLTPIPSTAVAGTAHATFIATGLVGAAAYVRSGELRTGDRRAMAVILSATSVVGALVGAALNAVVPRPVFGALLGAVAVLVGATVLYRDRRGAVTLYTLDVTTREGRWLLGTLGGCLGAISGLLGVGGPVLAVPALVLVGVPMLPAVAIAQVQSIFIAAFATAGYLLQGSVSVPLAALVGLPLLAGVVVGWAVAHRVDPGRLRAALGLVLIAVGPYLAV